MKLIDAYGNSIEKGSRVLYLGSRLLRVVEGDIYIVEYATASSFSQIRIRSESTSQWYYVYTRSVVVIIEDPVEFVEVLPV